MKLVTIPNYDEYRLDTMFSCYKWDPQFEDNNTVGRYALVLTEEEANTLKSLTEKIDNETVNAEIFLNSNIEVAKKLNLPKKIYREINSMKNYNPEKHVRLMRYDFHPTTDETWAVSEVNSDVPGGFAESTYMADMAKKYIGNNSYKYIDFLEILSNAIANKVREKGNIMMVHCTSYSDDRQVMQCLGDKLENLGFNVLYGAGDHVNFKDNEAYSILSNNECKLDGIFRFTPLEWLIHIKPKRWSGYFSTTTMSCNHPIAIFAQTKRFPLIWNELEKNGIKLDTWRELLPETLEVKDIKGRKGYIFKPAYGRVGEKISIKEACSEEEYKSIMREVKMFPKRYLAQKKFESKALIADDETVNHLCLGSYVVDGKHAGFYARLSKTPRIDSNAADIPVLVEGR